MPIRAIEDLLSAESRLDQSFAAAVLAYLSDSFWPVAARVLEVEQERWAGLLWLALFGALAVSYVWFAFAATAVAARVGRSRALVAGWILIVPILAALLPSLVAKLILEASPLSLKFILSREIRNAIHDQTLAD